MRRTIAVLVIAVLFLPAATVAQETDRIIHYTTSARPDTLVFDQDDFQRDENGERIRDEEGRYVPVRQFVTVTAEARMECAVPPDGHQIAFFADGPSYTLRNSSSNEVETILLELEPKAFNATWRQSGINNWTASRTVEVDVVSQGRPQDTIEANYTWFAERVDIPEACPQEAQAPDVTPHTVIIPGDEFDPEDFDLPDDVLDGPGRPIPAPGALLVVGALGLAAVARRRP